MNIKLRKLGAVLVVAVLTAAGCGGSSGGGDSVSPPPTTTPPPPTTPPPSGGIIRTGVAVGAGPITGFGSIIVNGITYDTSSATFTRDDNPSSQDEFEVGETVIVKGTIDDDNTNAVAETVELDEIVEGPVSSVNADGSLTVLGQTVTFGLDTAIDDSCPASFDDASIGAVEVYGDVDATGAIAATRIECKIPPGDVIDEYEVNGTVSGLDTANFTFMINGLEVNYASALIDDNFPGGTTTISEGDPVEVEGLPADFNDGVTPPVMGASKVEYKGDVLGGNEGDHYEVDGFIRDFVSAADFNLNVGTVVIPVTATSSTVYEGGTEADLANNLKIEVEGELDADGVLNATKIEIKTSTNIRVTGQVDSVSTANGTITILGITVNTDVLKTQFEDKSEAGIEPFSIGDVNPDDYIEARGQEQPAGEITAFRVERDDFDVGDDTELRGFVEEGSVVAFEQIVILGVTVDTTNVQADDYSSDDNTPISAQDFWDAVGTGGVIVDVNGSESTDGTTLIARELQLEME